WVLCSWDENNRTWSPKYNDLHGGYGEFRTNSSSFDFSTDSRRDDMYVITRGVKDSTFGVDTGIDFDFENKTSLSFFVDSNSQLNIRINITTNQNPFNVSFQSFGVAPFYWGLFSTRFDRYYIQELSFLTDPTYYPTPNNLLDLRVENFEVINCTGDKYLDIIVTLGEEDDSNSIGPRFLLFDIKNKESKISWGINKSIFPRTKIKILNLNSSLNNWIVSGRFSQGTQSYYAHKKVSSINWTNKWSFFENYSENPSNIQYGMSINSSAPSTINTTFFEIPYLINLNENGMQGIVLGNYNSESNLTQILVRDLQTGKKLSTIDILGLTTRRLGSQGNMFNLQSYVNAHKLVLAKYDINNNGYYDYIAVYKHKIIKIIDGKTNEIFFNINFDNNQPFNFPIGIPATFISGTSQQESSRILIGVEAFLWDNEYSKFSKIFYYNPSSSNIIKPITTWEIEEDQTLREEKYYSENREKGFIDDMQTIGDINGDNKTDVLVSRNYYYKAIDPFSATLHYTFDKISEIIDPYNKKILIRFPYLIDSCKILNQISISSSGLSHYLIQRDAVSFCLNGKYRLELKNLKENKRLENGNFQLEWNSNLRYEYVQIFVDDIEHSKITTNHYLFALGSGEHKIEVRAYDINGYVISLQTVNIFVKEGITYNVISGILFTSFIGVTTLLVLYKRYRKKKVLIDLDAKKEGFEYE
ncbi:MAG: hypothetical protein P8Y70_19615, partial [Candidatus Lokiarchaeota archaeon]